MPAGTKRVAAAPVAGALARVERLTGLTPTGLTVIGCAGLAWLGAYSTGSRAAFLMVYTVIALLIALVLFGRRHAPLIASRSDIPVRIREGRTVRVELEIAARGRTGTIILEEELGVMGPPVRLLVSSVARDEPVRHEYSFTPSLRGVYPVGPLVAAWGDPFGLTRKRTILLPAAQLIVHPSIESVHDRVLSREWEDPPIRPPVSKPWPTGFEFYGMREYVSGDDPRRIVWRAVARTGRYLVREAEQGITDRVTLILDTDARRHSKEQPSETFEMAVRTVASLASLHLHEGFAITIETQERTLVSALRGERMRLRLLDELARVGMGRESVSRAIARVIADPRRDTHQVIVTPYLDVATTAMLRLLLDRGGSITFVHVVGEDVEPGSKQRAAALGCEVIELRPGQPLETVFRRAVGAGLRR